ncbi:unnamed protein product [Candida verbasci]|uniref:WAC domain-containing protein n=1 Tax=Candida verbasci TaxID=1227364 RepID=A0A9W4U114_9ASCO|nr:unnamed protein product [Candida verbasci]
MVLYKRKQVKFVPPPPVPRDLNTQVWVINETKEWFLSYEDYLSRLDYYNQNKFVCEITGNSCLTYFEAFDSELHEKKEVDKNFPEALKEHLLRYLNFNRCTRLDQLVDKVYTMFKNDYFPGETIYLRNLDQLQSQQLNVTTNSSIKSRGIIREKVQYSQDQPTKYLVISLINGQQQIVSSHNISRDRNHFTKWLIKTFIKLTMSRSHKVGAPWVVKTKYAKKYSIPTIYPDDLKQFIESTPTGEISYIQPKKKRGPQPNDDTEKRKKIKDELTIHIMNENNNIPYRRKFPNHYIPEIYQKELMEEDDIKGTPSGLSQFQPTKKTLVEDLTLKFDLQNPKPKPKLYNIPENARTTTTTTSTTSTATKQKLTSISEALQSWIFINVYHNVLNIDTFTFDDYVYAMGWNLKQFNKIGNCELLDEIWCCILSSIVSNEKPSPKEALKSKEKDQIFGLNINIPIENNDSEDEDEDEDEVNGSESESETETKALEIDDDDDDDDDEKSETEMSPKNKKKTKSPKPKLNHNAYEAMNHGSPWHEKLRRRNFKDGNWQCILLGVLSMVEHISIYKPIIEEIYKTLAPSNQQPNPTTIKRNFYQHLNINLKFKAINILTDLIMTSSPLVRNYIDESLENSTAIRRQRLENLKEYRIAYELLRNAQDYIGSELPEGITPSTTLELNPTELELSKSDPEFKKQINIRIESINKMNQIRNDKKIYETKLTELDCQRVKLLGKDRLYNRYWWFENNGLPNLQHSRRDEDEDEDEDEENENENAKEKIKEEEVEEEDISDSSSDSDDEVKDETYLMGRLWVQGPCDHDLNVNFKLDPEKAKEIDELLDFQGIEESILKPSLKRGEPKKMNFENLSPNFKSTVLKNFNLDFHDSDIYKVNDIKKEIIEKNGTNNMEQEQVQDKENISSDLILNHEGSLLRPLNEITNIQRKLIEECPDPLLNGSNWRYYDSPEEISKLISWLNPWGKRESSLRKELSSAKEAIISSMKARRKALWIDCLPSDEIKLKKNIQELENYQNGNDKENEEENEEIGTKRRLKTRDSSRKKQKLNSIEDVLQFGDIEDRKNWIDKFQKELDERQYQRELARVTEWINSKALDEFGMSLYEGGDKKNKGRPSKKKDKKKEKDE